MFEPEKSVNFRKSTFCNNQKQENDDPDYIEIKGFKIFNNCGKYKSSKNDQINDCQNNSNEPVEDYRVPPVDIHRFQSAYETKPNNGKMLNWDIFHWQTLNNQSCIPRYNNDEANVYEENRKYSSNKKRKSYLENVKEIITISDDENDPPPVDQKQQKNVCNSNQYKWKENSIETGSEIQKGLESKCVKIVNDKIQITINMGKKSKANDQIVPTTDGLDLDIKKDIPKIDPIHEEIHNPLVPQRKNDKPIGVELEMQKIYVDVDINKSKYGIEELPVLDNGTDIDMSLSSTTPSKKQNLDEILSTDELLEQLDVAIRSNDNIGTNSSRSEECLPSSNEIFDDKQSHCQEFDNSTTTKGKFVENLDTSVRNKETISLPKRSPIEDAERKKSKRKWSLDNFLLPPITKRRQSGADGNIDSGKYTGEVCDENSKGPEKSLLVLDIQENSTSQLKSHPFSLNDYTIPKASTAKMIFSQPDTPCCKPIHTIINEITEKSINKITKDTQKLKKTISDNINESRSKRRKISETCETEISNTTDGKETKKKYIKTNNIKINSDMKKKFQKLFGKDHNKNKVQPGNHSDTRIVPKTKSDESKESKHSNDVNGKKKSSHSKKSNDGESKITKKTPENVSKSKNKSEIDKNKHRRSSAAQDECEPNKHCKLKSSKTETETDNITRLHEHVKDKSTVRRNKTETEQKKSECSRDEKIACKEKQSKEKSKRHYKKNMEIDLKERLANEKLAIDNVSTDKEAEKTKISHKRKDLKETNTQNISNKKLATENDQNNKYKRLKTLDVRDSGMQNLINKNIHEEVNHKQEDIATKTPKKDVTDKKYSNESKHADVKDSKIKHKKDGKTAKSLQNKYSKNKDDSEKHKKDYKKSKGSNLNKSEFKDLTSNKNYEKCQESGIENMKNVNKNEKDCNTSKSRDSKSQNMQKEIGKICETAATDSLKYVNNKDKKHHQKYAASSLKENKSHSSSNQSINKETDKTQVETTNKNVKDKNIKRDCKALKVADFKNDKVENKSNANFQKEEETAIKNTRNINDKNKENCEKLNISDLKDDRNHKSLNKNIQKEAYKDLEEASDGTISIERCKTLRLFELESNKSLNIPNTNFPKEVEKEDKIYTKSINNVEDKNNESGKKLNISLDSPNNNIQKKVYKESEETSTTGIIDEKVSQKCKGLQNLELKNDQSHNKSYQNIVQGQDNTLIDDVKNVDDKDNENRKKFNFSDLKSVKNHNTPNKKNLKEVDNICKEAATESLKNLDKSGKHKNISILNCNIMLSQIELNNNLSKILEDVIGHNQKHENFKAKIAEMNNRNFTSLDTTTKDVKSSEEHALSSGNIEDNIIQNQELNISETNEKSKVENNELMESKIEETYLIHPQNYSPKKEPKPYFTVLEQFDTGLASNTKTLLGTNDESNKTLNISDLKPLTESVKFKNEGCTFITDQTLKSSTTKSTKDEIISTPNACNSKALDDIKTSNNGHSTNSENSYTSNYSNGTEVKLQNTDSNQNAATKVTEPFHKQIKEEITTKVPLVINISVKNEIQEAFQICEPLVVQELPIHKNTPIVVENNCANTVSIMETPISIDTLDKYVNYNLQKPAKIIPNCPVIDLTQDSCENKDNLFENIGEKITLYRSDETLISTPDVLAISATISPLSIPKENKSHIKEEILIDVIEKNDAIDVLVKEEKITPNDFENVDKELSKSGTTNTAHTIFNNKNQVTSNKDSLPSISAIENLNFHQTKTPIPNQSDTTLSKCKVQETSFRNQAVASNNEKLDTTHLQCNVQENTIFNQPVTPNNVKPDPIISQFKVQEVNFHNQAVNSNNEKPVTTHLPCKVQENTVCNQTFTLINVKPVTVISQCKVQKVNFHNQAIISNNEKPGTTHLPCKVQENTFCNQTFTSNNVKPVTMNSQCKVRETNFYNQTVTSNNVKPDTTHLQCKVRENYVCNHTVILNNVRPETTQCKVQETNFYNQTVTSINVKPRIKIINKADTTLSPCEVQETSRNQTVTANNVNPETTHSQCKVQETNFYNQTVTSINVKPRIKIINKADTTLSPCEVQETSRNQTVTANNVNPETTLSQCKVQETNFCNQAVTLNNVWPATKLLQRLQFKEVETKLRNQIVTSNNVKPITTLSQCKVQETNFRNKEVTPNHVKPHTTLSQYKVQDNNFHNQGITSNNVNARIKIINNVQIPSNGVPRVSYNFGIGNNVQHSPISTGLRETFENGTRTVDYSVPEASKVSNVLSKEQPTRQFQNKEYNRNDSMDSLADQQNTTQQQSANLQQQSSTLIPLSSWQKCIAEYIWLIVQKMYIDDQFLSWMKTRDLICPLYSKELKIVERVREFRLVNYSKDMTTRLGFMNYAESKITSAHVHSIHQYLQTRSIPITLLQTYVTLWKLMEVFRDFYNKHQILSSLYDVVSGAIKAITTRADVVRESRSSPANQDFFTPEQRALLKNQISFYNLLTNRLNAERISLTKSTPQYYKHNDAHVWNQLQQVHSNGHQTPYQSIPQNLPNSVSCTEVSKKVKNYHSRPASNELTQFGISPKKIRLIENQVSPQMISNNSDIPSFNNTSRISGNFQSFQVLPQNQTPNKIDTGNSNSLQENPNLLITITTCPSSKNCTTPEKPSNEVSSTPLINLNESDKFKIHVDSDQKFQLDRNRDSLTDHGEDIPDNSILVNGNKTPNAEVRDNKETPTADSEIHIKKLSEIIFSEPVDIKSIANENCVDENKSKVDFDLTWVNGLDNEQLKEATESIVKEEEIEICEEKIILNQEQFPEVCSTKEIGYEDIDLKQVCSPKDNGDEANRSQQVCSPKDKGNEVNGFQQVCSPKDNCNEVNGFQQLCSPKDNGNEVNGFQQGSPMEVDIALSPQVYLSADEGVEVASPTDSFLDHGIDDASSTNYGVEATLSTINDVETSLLTNNDVEATLSTDSGVEATLSTINGNGVETTLLTNNDVETTLSTDSGVESTLSTDIGIETTLSTDGGVEAALLKGNNVEKASTTDNRVEAAPSTEIAVDIASQTDNDDAVASDADRSVDVVSPTDSGVEATFSIDNGVKTTSPMDNDDETTTFTVSYFHADSPIDEGVDFALSLQDESFTDDGFNNASVDRSVINSIVFANRYCICSKPAVFICCCQVVMYCSSWCQIKNWVEHRHVCINEYPKAMKMV